MRFVNRMIHLSSSASPRADRQRPRSALVGALALWAVVTGFLVYVFATIPIVRDHAKLTVWLVVTAQPLLVYSWLRRRGNLPEKTAVDVHDRTLRASRPTDTLGRSNAVPPTTSTMHRSTPSTSNMKRNASIENATARGRDDGASHTNGHHGRSEDDEVATTGSDRRAGQDSVLQTWTRDDETPTIQLADDRVFTPTLPTSFDRRSGAMVFDAGAVTDHGRRRSNEDSALITPVLLGVADGVGGIANGGRASQTALESVVHSLTINPDTSLTEAVMISNDKVRRDLGDGRENTPATTLDVVYLDETGDLTGAHIGDSRVGILARHDQRVEWLTTDHSIGNTLIRSVGATQNVAPDVWMHEVEAGDLVIVATDGLWKTPQGSTDIELVLIRLRDQSPNDIARALVAAALHAGASDNVTVIVGRVIQR